MKKLQRQLMTMKDVVYDKLGRFMLWITPVLLKFNCLKTITIQMCKQITSNTFKNEITYKLFNYKSYMYISI